MAKNSSADPVSEYLAEIGRRGGEARVPKGFSSLTDEERIANAKKAAEARWGKRKPISKKASKSTASKAKKAKTQ